MYCHRIHCAFVSAWIKILASKKNSHNYLDLDSYTGRCAILSHVFFWPGLLDTCLHIYMNIYTSHQHVSICGYDHMRLHILIYIHIHIYIYRYSSYIDSDRSFQSINTYNMLRLGRP